MINSVFVDARGCLNREVDVEWVLRWLEANGYKEVPEDSKADFIIVGTCAVNQINEDYSMVNIRRLLKAKKKHAQLIVLGCLSDIAPERILQCSPVIKYFGPRSLKKISDIFPNVSIPLEKIDRPARFRFKKDQDTAFALIRPDYRQKLLVSFKENSNIVCIATGCLLNCSYCVERRAIGHLKSKPLPLIISEFKKGLDEGIRNFTITGGDTGAYGIDLKIDVLHLFEALVDLDRQFHVAVTACNPSWIYKKIDKLVQIIKKKPNMIKHMVIPMQSASNKLLTQMERPYKAEHVANIFEKLILNLRKTQLHTHILVGFPGETMEDIGLLQHFINKFPTITYWLFRYSERAGTKAAEIENKISPDEIERRYSLLAQTCKESSSANCGKINRNISASKLMKSIERRET